MKTEKDRIAASVRHCLKSFRGVCSALALVLFTPFAAEMAPAATVTVDSDCIGMGSVFWSEKKLANGVSRLTLRATAEDGFVFSGWSVAESDVVAWPDDLRYPGTLTATVFSNAVVEASFAARADDFLEFDIEGLLDGELVCGEKVSQELMVDSVSFPEVTFSNLPKGLAYDARTLTVFGEPTEPGVYEIEASGVNASGFTFRSFATVRVANVDGPRLSGDDTEIALGAYWFAEPADIFSFAEEPDSVSLSGDVPGLTWNEGWQLLYGTPTEPGEYTLRAEACFPTGTVETATMLLTVAGADPDDYGIDLDFLDGLSVGDAADASECVLGPDASDADIRSVRGLPTGLSAVSWWDRRRLWGVSGTVREAGRYAVRVEVVDSSGETQRIATVCRTVTVADVPDVYLAVATSDAALGKVSGGGAVSPFDDVRLVAEPSSGCVFSGWYDADGEVLVLQEGVDYRTAEVTLPAGTDFAFLAPVAHFAAKAEDVAPDLGELDGADFSFPPDESFETSFIVDSLSLPTLSFKGLPKGVTCTATGAGEFVLAYDPQISAAASGRYTVTATAVNASGRTSSVAFRMTVETRSDARIHVYDDYGEFDPGVEIDAIDLSDAVDFERGETLSVSGLPKGLVYNAKPNEKKGVEAHTITGTPTVPGEYTLTFTARVVSDAATNGSGKVNYAYETATATAFLTVLPYPEIVIDVDEDAAAAGCRVSGGGNYKPGTKVTLKATAAKGWVFAGWDGLDEVEGIAALAPNLKYVSGEDECWVQAYFVPVSEDALFIGAPMPSAGGFAAEWPLGEDLDGDDATLVADLIETVSWPTVKVAGLPAGVRFSASTLRLSGKPTKSGVFHVTVTAKSAGGYSFVRVIDVAVLNADGSLPAEKALENPAAIDFTPLARLTTGVYCPTGSVVLAVGAKPGSGAAVKKLSVSGLPAGLSAAATLDDGGASVEVTGTPTKPGRQTVSVSVSYADGKTLKSQAAVVVEDGGSRYLFVTAGDAAGGTVSGEGVYASGATVKLSAKAVRGHVFAGWFAQGALFAPLRDVDGIDPRTATVSFPFRPADFSDALELTGSFGASSDDAELEILLEDDVWEVDPSAPSSFSFTVESMSAPKVSVTGLPKGVTVDAARGVLAYAPNAATEPGIHAVTVSAKNATLSRATAKTFELRVANRVSDAIGGLDPDMDAYPLSVGTTVDPSLIAPTVDEGWTLSAKGLPSGLSFKNGVITGVPSKAGDYTVTFTATSGKGSSKRTETATITLRVSSLPSSVTGSFSGVLTDVEESVVGTVSVTATAAGKVSVSVKTASDTVSFTAKSWDAFSNGVATVSIAGKADSACVLSVMATDDWQAWQATGSVVLTAGDDALAFSAQRNAYGKKDGDDEARDTVSQMAGKSTLDGWTVKIAATGTVTISGKYEGKKVSGSAILQWDEDGPFVQYVKFVDKKSLIHFIFRFDSDGSLVSWHATENP